MMIVNSTLEQKVFLALLLVVTIAFGWILLPFYGAVFWAVILAIIFAPLQRRLYQSLGNRRNLTALLTLLVCLIVAVLPVILITGLLVQEGTELYKQIESGEMPMASYTLIHKEATFSEEETQKVVKYMENLKDSL